jgi:hypothetical protein
VGEVLKTLSERVDPTHKATVEAAQRALAQLPILNDLPFEEVYLRATNK